MGHRHYRAKPEPEVLAADLDIPLVAAESMLAYRPPAPDDGAWLVE